MAFERLVRRFRCLGFHRWKRVSVQANGIGFLDECENCGRGRYLAFAGVASSVGQVSAEEMAKWHYAANPENFSREDQDGI